MISLPPSINQLPETNVFCVPALCPAPAKEVEDFLTKETQKVYHFCLNNKKQITGSLFLTLAFDLSKKKIEILNSSGEKVQVNKIKISSYLVDQRCDSLKWIFELQNACETYTTPQSDDISPSLHNGMEYERIFPETLDVPMRPSETWDTWERSHEYLHYENIIHPKIIDTIGKIYNVNPQRKLNILDLGGGSGRLAEKVLQRNSGKIKKILVADKSLALLKEANIKAQRYPGKMFGMHLDLNEINSLSTSKFFKTTDLIILCGVVAHQVLTKKTAKKVLEECLPVIKENGYIIAISLSPSLLNSEDYEAFGLKVLNKSFTFFLNRGPLQAPYATNDFYVLQKSKT
jgi:2-polyprenyl-3-methyl-5-hydroxy-6-metoxy-1,4-benzoquinol methylase